MQLIQSIDLKEELTAFEYLYTTDAGKSRIAMHKKLQGRLPHEVVREDLFYKEKSSALSEYLSKIIYKDDISFLVNGASQFPYKLNDAKYSLPVVYYRGDIGLAERASISVVGSRNMSALGLARARIAAQTVVDAGAILVSGLANGIDTEAIKTAIAYGGKVIGVIGTPINFVYPKQNLQLQEEVATQHLLISQVPIYHYHQQAFNTRRYYFPERNITMAALSKATIIVEASETSGTRIQANACIEQGRELILFNNVVEMNSWAQAYAKQGAHVVSNQQELYSLLMDVVDTYEYA